MIKPFHLVHWSMFLFSYLGVMSLVSCNNQTQSKHYEKGNILGGNCAGCEFMYEEMPEKIQHSDTCSAWGEAKNRLIVNGKVFKLDGRTPAKDVVLYYWQANGQGQYSNGVGKSKSHGSLRGWVKTNTHGEFNIYTLRPASYPNKAVPAHIHLVVKEPDKKKEYYIDNIEFSDDPLLSQELRSKRKNRGGSGIVQVHMEKDCQVAERTVILGLNIPNYPELPSRYLFYTP